MHTERGIRVVKFIKLSKAIPKRVVVAGIEIGFKYSGQPATCLRRHSMDHVVKDCPKRRKNPSGAKEGVPNPPPPPPQNHSPDRAQLGADAFSLAANGTGESQPGTPELFSQPISTHVHSQAETNKASSDTEMHTANAKKRDRPSGSEDEGEPAKKTTTSSPEELPTADAEITTSPGPPVLPPPGFSAPAESSKGGNSNCLQKPCIQPEWHEACSWHRSLVLLTMKSEDYIFNTHWEIIPRVRPRAKKFEVKWKRNTGAVILDRSR